MSVYPMSKYPFITHYATQCRAERLKRMLQDVQEELDELGKESQFRNPLLDLVEKSLADMKRNLAFLSAELDRDAEVERIRAAGAARWLK